MTPRKLVLAFFAAASCAALFAQSPSPPASPAPLVKRVLAVDTLAADPALKLGSQQLAYLSEVLRSVFQTDTGFVVAESKDSADTELKATIGLKGKTSVIHLSFSDKKKPGSGLEKDYPVNGALDGSLADSVFPAMRKDLTPLLGAIAQTVKVQVDEKVEQRIEVKEVQRGIALTITGLPGETITFVNGDIQTIGESGSLVLPDLPQNSSLVATGALAGHYDKKLQITLGDSDAGLDATLDPFERFSLSLSAATSDGTIGFEFAYGVIPGRLALQAFLMTSLIQSIGEHEYYEGNEAKSSPGAFFIEPDFGAILYFFKEDSFFQLGVQAQIGTRFDIFPDGFELSRRVTINSRLLATAEVRITRNLSVYAGVGPRLFVSRVDLGSLNRATRGSYYYPDNDANYGYNEEESNSVASGDRVFVRPEFKLGIRVWF